MNTRALVVLVPVALVLLSACSGGSDRDPDGAASGSPSTTQSASSSTGSTPEVLPDTEGILDPCTMVTRDYAESLVPEKRRTKLVFDRELNFKAGILVNSFTTRYSCVLRFNDTGKKVLTWGYFPEAFSAAKIEKLLILAGGTDVTTKVGFTAALTGDLLSSEAYGVLHDDVGIFVVADESIDSVERKDPRTPRKVMLAHLKEIGRGAYYARTQEPIDIPSYCPKAKSPEVKAAFGPVDVARGTRDSEGRTWCLYRHEKDLLNLTLSAFQLTDDVSFDVAYDAVKNASGNVDMIEGPDGVLMSVGIGNDGGADLQFVDPNRFLYIGTNIHYRADNVRPRRDQDAVVALTKAFGVLLDQP